MADPTVSSIEVKDGVLHIYGSAFTQTTTTVYVDEDSVAHEYVSATELTVTPAPQPGHAVAVEKGGVRTDPQTVEGGSATSQDAPGATGVVREDSNTTGPMTPSQPYPEGTPTATQVAPPPTPADYMTEQEKNPEPGPLSEPVSPGEIEPNPVAAKQPYPTGNPRDPEADFFAAHGYYRRAPEDVPAAAGPHTKPPENEPEVA